MFNSTLLKEHDTRKAAKVLRAVNHQLRRQIIALLAEQRRMSVTEIFVALRLEQSVCSQHLGILLKEGVVGRQRDGKYVVYFLQHKRLEEINRIAGELARAV